MRARASWRNSSRVMVQARRAIEDAARGKADISVAQAMPKDLGEWFPSVEFYLGPFSCGKDFAELSVVDFQRSNERDVDAYCRQGFGALLAKLAEGLPVQVSTPVTRINTQGARRHHARNRRQGRAAGARGHRHGLHQCARRRQAHPRSAEAAARRARTACGSAITSGSRWKFPDNPFGLARDDLVFEKTDGKRTAALLGNVGGIVARLCRRGGIVRPRPCRERPARDDRLRDGMARQAVRRPT